MSSPRQLGLPRSAPVPREAFPAASREEYRAIKEWLDHVLIPALVREYLTAHCQPINNSLDGCLAESSAKPAGETIE